MKLSELVLFLTLQLTAIVVAGAAFALIETRLIAGAIAGSYFILSGLYMVLRTFRYAGKWRLALWYPLLTHVFLISIPMVVVRFLNSGSDFGQVKIWGLDGPTFHRLSTIVFVSMVLGTLIDIFRARYAKSVANNG